MKKLLFLIIFLAALAIGIALLPARLAMPYLLPGDWPVQLQEVSGTVWKGRAGRALYQGRELGQLGWRLHPRALLRGVLEADLILSGAEYSGSGRAARGHDDSLRLSDARIDFPAEVLGPALDIPNLRLQGRVQLQLDSLELYQKVPVELKGEAVWHEAGVIGVEQAYFGALKARFASLPEGGFGGSLFDAGGPLLLEGDFRVSLLGYEIDARLAARDGNPQVRGVLHYIGQLQPDGSVHYQARGHLLGGL